MAASSADISCLMIILIQCANALPNVRRNLEMMNEQDQRCVSHFVSMKTFRRTFITLLIGWDATCRRAGKSARASRQLFWTPDCHVMVTPVYVLPAKHIRVSLVSVSTSSSMHS